MDSNKQQRELEYIATQEALDVLAKQSMQLTETYKELAAKAAKLKKSFDPEELKTLTDKKKNQLHNHETINKHGKSTD